MTADEGPAERSTEDGRASDAHFLWLWGGGALANLADGTLLAAGPLLAATLTRDPAEVAGLVTAQRLPWFLLSLLSGTMVDRLDRRRVLLISNLARALILSGLVAALVAGWLNLLWLLGAFFLLGTIETFTDNALTAILPSLVRRSRLPWANGRVLATQTVMNELAGPPLGGLFFSALVALPFGAGAVFYAVAASLLSILPARPPSPHDEQVGGSALLSATKDGLLWFWRHRLLRSMAFLAAFANFSYAATSAVFVLLAQERIGLGPSGYGLVLGGGAIGGIFAGLTSDHLSGRLGPSLTLTSMHLLPALALAGLALTRQPAVAGVFFALISFSATVANVLLITLRQTIIPDALLGRVTSAYRFVGMGALPSGALAGGFLARALGLTAPYWMGAAILTGAAVALLLWLDDRAFQPTPRAPVE